MCKLVAITGAYKWVETLPRGRPLTLHKKTSYIISSLRAALYFPFPPAYGSSISSPLPQKLNKTVKLLKWRNSGVKEVQQLNLYNQIKYFLSVLFKKSFHPPPPTIITSPQLHHKIQKNSHSFLISCQLQKTETWRRHDHPPYSAWIWYMVIRTFSVLHKPGLRILTLFSVK